jgi:DNA-directed RNA polymerase subunit M/transcription elongation factor TFIIS
MIIKCFRCGKELHSPNDSNADYIMAEDTKVNEPRTVFIILKQTDETLNKAKNAEPIDDSEYEAVESLTLDDNKSKGAVKIKTEIRTVNIQKTGIICPDCYKDTDTIIWGVHKQHE